MDTVIYAVGIASFAVMFLASFSTCLVGIELIGVLQLAYLNLADNKYVHLFLSPLIGWFFVNGYNILPTRFGAGVPESIRQISHSNLFLENVNIMFAVLVLVTVLFLAFEFAVSKFDLNWPKTQTLVREVFMATYLFGCFNTAFSISIHCKYFSVDDLLTPLGILSSVCAALSVLMYSAVTLWFIAARKFKWGEYTEKFKHDITNQMYIPLTMMYRFGLGLYMGFDNE